MRARIKVRRTGVPRTTAGSVLVAMVMLAGCGEDGSSAPSYKIKTRGSVPSQQTLGVPVRATMDVINRGPAIPNLALDLSTATDHWVITEVISEINLHPRKSPVGDYWVLGKLPRGTKTHIVVALTPKDAGNHDLDFAFWPDVDDSGIPNGDEPLDILSTSVAITP